MADLDHLRAALALFEGSEVVARFATSGFIFESDTPLGRIDFRCNNRAEACVHGVTCAADPDRDADAPLFEKFSSRIVTKTLINDDEVQFTFGQDWLKFELLPDSENFSISVKYRDHPLSGLYFA